MAATAKPRLRDLPDVDHTAPAAGQTLVFNATSGKWEPNDVSLPTLVELDGGAAGSTYGPAQFIDGGTA